MKKNRSTAYHEAGHAVIAAALGILADDNKISIASRKYEMGWELGTTGISRDPSDYAWQRWGKRYLRKVILTIYAGPAVSIKLDPNLNLLEQGGSCESDIIGAEEYCAWIGDPHFSSDDPYNNKLVFETKNWKKAVLLVELNWPSIVSVADKLLKDRNLTGKQVKVAIATLAKRLDRQTPSV